jgi:MFS family permease
VAQRTDLLATRTGRRWLFALLYLAEGAPIGYVWWALPTRLRDAGVPIDDVTRLAALVTLPWAFKFLWAPLVDAFRPRGGLRVWIAGAQLAMGLSLLPILWLDPLEQMGLLLAVLLVHAVSAATQDVSIDALAVATIPAGERGATTGWMQVGMLTGRALFGGVALAAERWVGAGTVVALLIGFVWLSAAVLWRVRERPAADALASPTSGAAGLADFARRLRRVLVRPATWLGLAIAGVAGAGMEATGTVAGPMLIDLGFDKAAVGRFFALPAVAAMGLGALLGGRVSDRGRRDARLAGAVGALALAVVALAGAVALDAAATPPVLFAALCAVYVLFGVYVASAYALFMDLTDPRLGGTQFSAYMSGVNLCSVWSSWAVGSIAAGWGYPTALATLAALSLGAWPLLALLRWRARRG